MAVFLLSLLPSLAVLAVSDLLGVAFSCSFARPVFVYCAGQ